MPLAVLLNLASAAFKLVPGRCERVSVHRPSWSCEWQSVYHNCSPSPPAFPFTPLLITPSLCPLPLHDFEAAQAQAASDMVAGWTPLTQLALCLALL